jgi:hypothetical protein
VAARPVTTRIKGATRRVLGSRASTPGKSDAKRQSINTDNRQQQREDRKPGYELHAEARGGTTLFERVGDTYNAIGGKVGRN